MYDAIGIVGVFIILSAYFLLQIERIGAKSLLYSSLNLIGSILILISLTHTFNLASVVIEVAWILVSLLGIIKALHRKKEK